MIKLATTKEELEKIFQLRYEVLRKPWNQTYESSFDELDKISYNAFIEESSICIACGRLDILNSTTAQIRYMAVKPEYRGKHYGQQVLVYLEKLAKEKGIQKIILHARENAVDFYLKNNYKIIQPSHLLFNTIQHYLMEKTL
ncbi:MAG TPA: GNAT family N-acetyltransferase [Bacteroidia bacterium]|nr:GNAT family N-acetyltransferase [Bacteroidia bacterium]